MDTFDTVHVLVSGTIHLYAPSTSRHDWMPFARVSRKYSIARLRQGSEIVAKDRCRLQETGEACCRCQPKKRTNNNSVPQAVSGEQSTRTYNAKVQWNSVIVQGFIKSNAPVTILGVSSSLTVRFRSRFLPFQFTMIAVWPGRRGKRLGVSW